MTRNMHRKLKVRIYVEERNERVWVPYKTLIGYNIRNCPIIGRLWDQVYCVKEFASKSQAIEETKRQARMRILDLFGNAEESEAEWEVVHECGPELVMVTHPDASQVIVTEAVSAGVA